MLNALQIEHLKTKRTVVRKLIWLFPILVIIVIFAIFANTGYVVESFINQWSFLWLTIFLALAIGLVDRQEKNSTQYKMILSSPANLASYEIGRIMHGVVLSFTVSLVFAIYIAMFSFFSPTKISILTSIYAISGIFLTTMWEIPLYTWLSRVTNLYVSVALAFAGCFSATWFGNLAYGKFWPFTLSALFPVSVIRIHINGIPVKNSAVLPNSSWTILASLLLFIALSWLAAISFRKQVIKNG